jgi:hypothetical protein
MAELVTLAQDGPLGKAGSQVWVDDPSQAVTPDGWTAPADPKASKSKAQAADAPLLDPPADPGADQPQS